MNRLTTDNPQGNAETALNLFFVKDGQTWVRGYGLDEKHPDISLNDLVRLIAEQHNLDMAQSGNDDEISEEMAYMLMESTDTPEGVVALLYCAAWVCAELRARLMVYEDAGITLEGITEAINRLCNCKIDCLLEDRNKLLEEIKQLGGMDRIRKAIEEQPKRGEWQGEGDGYADGAMVYDVWMCSECGYTIDDGTDDQERLPHYCPNCGANMKGELQ